MRGTAFCWIALAAAGCSFEGADGLPVDPQAPPAQDLPKGKARVTGVISSPAQLGTFGVALMPAAAALPASNPCFPKNTLAVETPSAVDRSFELPEVAPGEYTLVAYRVDDRRSPRELERTMKAITVSGDTADAGVITLPPAIAPQEREGANDIDLVYWTPPAGLLGATGFAYRIDGPGRNACTPGTSLTVSGTYEIPESRNDARIGLESPLSGQMAIKVVEGEGGRGGR
jgi:hypothetical protein